MEFNFEELDTGNLYWILISAWVPAGSRWQYQRVRGEYKKGTILAV